MPAATPCPDDMTPQQIDPPAPAAGMRTGAAAMPSMRKRKVAGSPPRDDPPREDPQDGDEAARASRIAALVAGGGAGRTVAADLNHAPAGPEPPEDPRRMSADALRHIEVRTGLEGAGDGAPAVLVRDICINDSRSRYNLTKGETQRRLADELGVQIHTRGKYYPDRKLATDGEPPLTLHIVAPSAEALERAVARIDEIMRVAPPPINAGRFSFRDAQRASPVSDGSGPPSAASAGPAAPPSARAEPRQIEARIVVDLQAPPGFPLRARVLGPGGENLKHIEHATRTRVNLRGNGSGAIERFGPGQRRYGPPGEQEDRLHVLVCGYSQPAVDDARALCEDLVKTLREELEDYTRGPPAPQASWRQDAPPPPPPPMEHAADGPPPPPPVAAPADGMHDYYAYYYGNNPAYASNPAYMQYYMQYYYGQSGAVPPPPGDNEAPPPPPSAP